MQSKPAPNPKVLRTEPGKKSAERADAPIKVLTTSQIRVSPSYERLVPRPTRQELKALEMSILTVGQLDPVDVNEEYLLLDGYSRFSVLSKLGRNVVARVMSFPTKEAEMDYVVKRASTRRNLSIFQKIMLAQHRLRQERKKAEERQRSGKKPTLGSNEPKVGKPVEIVAEEFGISGSTFFRGQYVIEHGTPKQVATVRNEQATINAMYDEIKAEEKAKLARIEDNSSKLSSGPDFEESKSDNQSDSEENHSVAGKDPELDEQAECNRCHRRFPRGALKQRFLCKGCRKEVMNKQLNPRRLLEQ